ncbi:MULTISPECIES: hypothetical protein [Paenibacillus]|uniref:hypothetical protein n=1 Tax=Paenibacillus TaxID=44249 RepID=UPI001FE63D09|nr:hypothetical protein [Paenibacillus anaericanus]
MASGGKLPVSQGFRLKSYTGDAPVGIGELTEHISPYRFSLFPYSITVVDLIS